MTADCENGGPRDQHVTQPGAEGEPTTGAGAEGEPTTGAVRRYVERLASVMVEAGIPRMPARIFAALLASDPGMLTAAELCDLLGASPAAVSGGVRYLVAVGMVSTESEPGSRRHHYRVPEGVWDELMRLRDRITVRWAAVLREGMHLLGADTTAGARMADSVQYFEFVSAELPRVLARWQESKDGRSRPRRR